MKPDAVVKYFTGSSNGSLPFLTCFLLLLCFGIQVARSKLSARPVPSVWQPYSCTGADDEAQVLREDQEDQEPEGGIKHQESSKTDVTCGWGPVVAEIWEVWHLRRLDECRELINMWLQESHH